MPTVGIIGTRGYPSYYGGFETAVRKLAPYLADSGWDVVVYGRPGTVSEDDSARDDRVLSVITRGVESKSLSTLTYGLSASHDAVKRRLDVALVMNVANGFWLPLLKRAGIPTLVNVDGIEWDRDKWGAVAKGLFYQGARLTAKYASGLVVDSEAIGSRWQSEFQRSGTFLPYGGDGAGPLETPLNLERRRYVLMVARFVPENSIDEFFAAVPEIQRTAPVVIVGSSGYGGEYDSRAASLAADYDDVTWLGHVSDDGLLASLWQNCGVYFHGHSVGGTNPALVQAMALGAPVVARDTVYNREVLDDAHQLTPPDTHSITRAIKALLADAAEQDRASVRNLHRAASVYSWDAICKGYEERLREMLEVAQGARRNSA